MNIVRFCARLERMPRTFKTPTRTISNKGEHPRFVGLLTSPKASGGLTNWYVDDAQGVVPYDSMSAMICALYLEWRQDVESFAFEPRSYGFDATDSLPTLRCIPDFEVVLTTGEIVLVEAKYSRDNLRDAEREKIALTTQHFAVEGRRYEVVYRQDLEVNGFADTIFLLRQFGLRPTLASILSDAERRLSDFDAADLATWRVRAVDAKVSVGLLYKLLYTQRLPLVYRPLQFLEMDKWHA
ncbi:hypothetical protein ACTJKQ_04065 [Acidovorax sp. 22279]|uniref:hypothetical protein n=1 Tax=Acidovorax sp. 22279 TaxID=3453900 RepID=UPI003F8552E3